VQYKKLDRCGLKDKFDTIILSEDAGYNKPSKFFFDYAFAKSGANASTTIMIGDSLTTDMQGAINAGIDTIYFRREGQQHSDDVMYTVESLVDICNIL
jgi:putative hydrolase of the HAD superfamily